MLGALAALPEPLAKLSPVELHMSGKFAELCKSEKLAEFHLPENPSPCH